MGKRKPIGWFPDSNGCRTCVSHYRDKKGYPLTKKNGKTMHIHRFVWEQWQGEIPIGMVVRHKCDNPACVNIEHLELGTVADNNRDMVERGRYKGFLKGEDNVASKLHEADVKLIKGSTLSGYRLANIFGVCKKTIYMIRRGVTWKHV